MAGGDESLPEQIGPDANLLWKTAIAEGISSPVVAGGRVFLTTVRPGPQLGTMALDAENGRLLWHAPAPLVYKAAGKRLATPSPATDGELVFSFFDASGLLCYDRDGNLVWHRQFGRINNQFNHAASPVLIDDRVILVIDHDGDSYLVALDKRTGVELWRCHRFVFGRNYATPVVWSFDGRRFLVVAGSGMVTGYDVETGTPAWYMRGTSAVVNPTPLAAENGWLYVHSRSPSSGAKSSPFRDLLKAYDKSADGAVQLAELPHSFLNTFFNRFDRDGSGAIDVREYATFESLSRPFLQGMVAFKPGGLGDLTETNLAWTESRSMPRTPSALYHKGTLFTVNEGGVLQSLDAHTGELHHRGRIAARGSVFASPVLGDGKIYLGTRNGEVAVVSAEPQWKNLHSAELAGDIQASPAIANGRVYFRTDTVLYCFGLAAAEDKQRN